MANSKKRNMKTKYNNSVNRNKNNSYDNIKFRNNSIKNRDFKDNNKNLQKDNTSKEEKLSLTKQQQFDFGNLDLTSTLDTSFLDKGGKNKVKDESVEKFSYLDDYIIKPKSNKSLIIIFVFIILLLCGFIIFHYVTFNHHEVKVVEKTKTVKVVDDNYLFLGDSITEIYDLDKYYKDLNVVNSGVSGNVTSDILSDMENRVYKYNPSKVFILIGTNDIEREVDSDKIVSNIEKIIAGIKENRPYAKIYLESIYPVDEDKSGASKRKNSVIKDINKELKKYCLNNNVTYIDSFSILVNEEGVLKDNYSDDGLHLIDEGYKVVTKEIMKYIEGGDNEK